MSQSFNFSRFDLLLRMHLYPSFAFIRRAETYISFAVFYKVLQCFTMSADLTVATRFPEQLVFGTLNVRKDSSRRNVGFTSSGMWRCVFGSDVLDVSKGLISSSSRVSSPSYRGLTFQKTRILSNVFLRISDLLQEKFLLSP